MKATSSCQTSPHQTLRISGCKTLHASYPLWVDNLQQTSHMFLRGNHSRRRCRDWDLCLRHLSGSEVECNLEGKSWVMVKPPMRLVMQWVIETAGGMIETLGLESHEKVWLCRSILPVRFSTQVTTISRGHWTDPHVSVPLGVSWRSCIS